MILLLLTYYVAIFLPASQSPIDDNSPVFPERSSSLAAKSYT